MARFCYLVISLLQVIPLSLILPSCVSAGFIIPKPIRPDPPVDNPTEAPGYGGTEDPNGAEDPYGNEGPSTIGEPGAGSDGAGIGEPRFGTGTPDTQEPSAPFLESSEDDEELADKIKEMLDKVSSILPTNSASASSPTAAANFYAISTLTASSPVEIDAASACYIYGAYNSICSLGTDSAISTDSTAYASCLCYSSTYYVPAVYDIAAWACPAYDAGTSGPAPPTQNFCSKMGNVRNEMTAEFDQFEAYTTEGTATATSGPTSSITQTRSTQSLPNQTSSSVSAAGGLFKVEGTLLLCMMALTIAAGLL